MLRVIALLAAISGGMWIDVPFTHQEENGCGSASVWMVMEYWKQSPEAPETIHQALYSEEAEGVLGSDMERYFNDHGFDTAAFAGEWSDLADNVGQGRPVIVCLRANSRGTPLHYVVVAGTQEFPAAVLVNDPARRKLYPIARGEFEKEWEATHRWSLLALPKTPRLEPALPPAAAPPAAANEALEEASAAFRNDNYPLAKRLALRAIRNAPADPLANDFLGTLFLLEDNLEAALKYWNRADMPRIREVAADSIRLDHTMGISRGAVLRLDDYRRARKRLDASGAFSRYAFDLKPADGDDFDLGLRTAERGGVHPLSWLGGLPYQTISPQFINVGGRAINVESLWRWDAKKRRARLAVSAPLGESLRYGVTLDARDEEWDWNSQQFTLRKQEIETEVQGVGGANWTWSSGAAVSRRVSGLALKYRGSATVDVWQVPERGLAVTSKVRADAGKAFSGAGRFGRMESDSRFRWRAASVRFRAGRVLGSAPFDELFSIGMDRDNELWMRGHPGTRDGRKGAGLIGSQYLLWNSEVEKTVFDSAFINVKAAPLLDVARMGGWFVDTGVDIRISLAELLHFSLSIGRDLKAGRTVLFTNITR